METESCVSNIPLSNIRLMIVLQFVLRKLWIIGK